MVIYLRTDRVQLRRFTTDDVDNLVELDSDPEVMRYLTGGRPTPREQVRDRMLPRLLAYYDAGDAFGYWVAQDRTTAEFLGWFLFRPDNGFGPAGGPPRDGIELGYRLRRSTWGRGYATEVSRALVHKGFTELGVERVYAETMAINTGSRRVLEKAGLRYTGIFYPRWPEPIPGEEHGEVQYALTRSEWQELQAQRG